MRTRLCQIFKGYCDPQQRPENQAAACPRKAVEAIPQAHRHRLLGQLTRGDILDLWRLAGQRYSASPAQLQTAIHPSYYAPDQFPSQPDQVLLPACMLEDILHKHLKKLVSASCSAMATLTSISRAVRRLPACALLSNQLAEAKQSKAGA